ncbi:MAG TPA: hypothetical protein VJT80_05730 [Steroidobacteraceae bacterium]|nr:hypothetical protein [Steroidobacteraceae bacterium]
MRSILNTLLATAVFAFACSTVVADEQVVVVNGVQLPNAAVTALQLAYRTIIPSGRYWYDPASGLWGREGQALAGQMHAGLQIGGALDEDASDGDTDVYVNGRRLPRAELHALQQLVGPVRPGRYWLDPYGNAGFEGGPPLVNLAQARARGAQGYAGWNNNTPFGNWGGDGNCSYYNNPNGDSVMIGNC